MRIQWLEWASVLGLAIFFIRQRVKNSIERNLALSESSITWLLVGFGVAGLCAKLSQYFSLSLNAQDFWLFVELLQSTKSGNFFITHFAPQGWGPVQHGAIHPFLPWALLAPFTYVFGDVGVALLFNPLCFAGAGWMLDRIGSHFGLKVESRFLIVAAFLFSKQSSLTIMYDVHPEALYPLLSFGMVYALLSESWRTALFYGTTLGILKEDSFMVLWACGISVWFLRPNMIRRLWSVGIVFLVSGAAYALQVGMIRFFGQHDFGGIIPATGAIAGGYKWDGPASIIASARALVDANGGFSGTLLAYGQFLISDSWRGILFPAPWVILSPGFWIAELPLTFSFSLRGANAVFWNYYSAPFLAFFWIFLVRSLSTKRIIGWAVAVLVLSLLNGSEGLVIKMPDRETLALREEAASFAGSIESLNGQGVVLARLLPFVPLSRVISDRLTHDQEEQSRVSYYFLTKELTSYNIPLEDLKATITELRKPGSGFKVIRETGRLILLGRSS